MVRTRGSAFTPSRPVVATSITLQSNFVAFEIDLFVADELRGNQCLFDWFRFRGEVGQPEEQFRRDGGVDLCVLVARLLPEEAGVTVGIDGGLACKRRAAGDQDLVGLADRDGRQDVEAEAGFAVRPLESVVSTSIS